MRSAEGLQRGRITVWDDRRRQSNPPSRFDRAKSASACGAFRNAVINIADKDRAVAAGVGRIVAVRNIVNIAASPIFSRLPAGIASLTSITTCNDWNSRAIIFNRRMTGILGRD
jgi:hypothetical protein